MSMKNEVDLLGDTALIDRIMAVPHDELRKDLEQIILYYTGKLCDDIPGEDGDDLAKFIFFPIMLLGEVGDKGSLDVILEVLRQSPDYFAYVFGILEIPIVCPSLYKLGNGRLDCLMEFAQEKGLYAFFKYLIFPVVVRTAILQPERRGEVIEWLRKFIRFVLKTPNAINYADRTLMGLVVCDLIDLKASELSGEVIELFDNNLVDKSAAGNCRKVINELQNQKQAPQLDEFELDLQQQIAQVRERILE